MLLLKTSARNLRFPTARNRSLLCSEGAIIVSIICLPSTAPSSLWSTQHCSRNLIFMVGKKQTNYGAVLEQFKVTNNRDL